MSDDNTTNIFVRLLTGTDILLRTFEVSERIVQNRELFPQQLFTALGVIIPETVEKLYGVVLDIDGDNDDSTERKIESVTITRVFVSAYKSYVDNIRTHRDNSNELLDNIAQYDTAEQHLIVDEASNERNKWCMSVRTLYHSMSQKD